MIRHEHRTLPVLIALGVLLGAGLAMASPAGHEARTGTHRSPAATATESSAPAQVSSSSAPPRDGSGADASSAGCDPVTPVPGWATSHEPLAHAIHVVGRCGDGGGLATAIGYLVADHASAQANGAQPPLGSHGGQPTGHAPSAHHHAGGGRDGTSGSNDGAGGGSDGSGGVDVIHGNGHDGDHGNDTNGGADPGSNAGTDRGSPTHGGPSPRGATAHA